MCVLSSRWLPGKIGGGFPVAILEAAAAILPLVTTRTCGADEIIINSVTGRPIELEDARDLAEAISDLLANTEKARDLAASLHRKVREEFTWRKAYESYKSHLS